ncbi:UDP-N-acetylmuramoyl-tripeptide--D-alanyl-D-alanine ligase [Virgisporangium aliadipatigenens]|uniref:UDP-N-acetylmuramoyl-tripeptide--D-alanyl-D-alanine ligase n=1 Tax=Virgisporangium aliadipatigenens TaxID=741659 RepID=A0A8J3YSZ4_9ACTN|nr:UDP-N-acetylmuramoyl-tripeptide--D-alanyl-D-alanine ligase [Virgisporangium aliadipatigenens]GIJ49912.1 UDP-N-acetylmuramoyl-tripeptide--D-alanyl-D-alanine ligase [Virgisporangium aliadipatigenens]
MIEMTLAEVAAAVGGVLRDADPDAVVTGNVDFDSRKVTPGGLFAAFDGDKVDGHTFAAATVKAGAVAVLASKPVDAPAILVDDVRAALQLLARAVVDRLPELTVIGVTGSSGKTTTKDLIAAILAGHAPTVATAGSFNNELGMPYTALQATTQTRYLVLEMGARKIGHIAYLCGIAPPSIGVVINVGVSHIGEFGSQEAIAQAKGELVEALPPTGLAVLNADDPLVLAMRERTRARVVTVGEEEHADLRATDVSVDARDRASFRIGDHRVTLAVPGRHQVGNALLAIAVARHLGVPDAEAALAGAKLPSERRMDVFDRTDGGIVIDDSYNANPASTAAALRALAKIGAGRRTIAVLGYMAELGEHERSGHEEVGRLAAELGIDRLIAVGQITAPMCDGAATVAGWGGESVQVTDQDAAVAWLREHLLPGDVVLVKASRYRTWQVADFLREEAVA